MSTISPYGTRPSLISAWKPLQIPSIRPSRFLRSSWTASLILGLRKNAVINLPLPSGSSPPLNPPGIIIICEFLIAFSTCSTDDSISPADKFLITMVSAIAPAFSKALAVSYSQFVPGNTGIRTLG